jgi:RNA polymerase sigma-70 factor (ECF subfamily)
VTTPSPDRFLELLEQHKGILYRVAGAYCRDRDDRADLIQDVIVQLWRSFDRFDGRCKFSTWMYRIAINVAISRGRSERRRIRDAVSLDDLGLDLAAADAALDAASDEVRQFHRVLARLDALDRMLVLLYVEGYSHDEIADVAGISTANVATRIHRLKDRLQRDATDASASAESTPAGKEPRYATR